MRQARAPAARADQRLGHTANVAIMTSLYHVQVYCDCRLCIDACCFLPMQLACIRGGCACCVAHTCMHPGVSADRGTGTLRRPVRDGRGRCTSTGQGTGRTRCYAGAGEAEILNRSACSQLADFEQESEYKSSTTLPASHSPQLI